MTDQEPEDTTGASWTREPPTKFHIAMEIGFWLGLVAIIFYLRFAL